MAAGDVNSRTVFPIGDAWGMTGTCEAANGTAVALTGTTHTLRFAIVQNADDEEGARVQLNHNGSEATNGTIYVTSAAADTDTWNYFAIYV